MTTKSITIREYARSKEIVERFKELVGPSANAYVAGVLLQVAERPELQRCDPKSIIGAALRAATMRLWVDPSLGQAYIVPFGGKATLIIGYRGLIEMAVRTNQYRHINAIDVDDGMEVTADELRGVHEVKRVKPGTRVVGYLAYFKTTAGYERSLYMSREEVERHAKKYSRSFGKADSPWTTEFDKMARKTVLRQLLKFAPLDPVASRYLATEEEEIEGEFADLPEPEDVTIEPPPPPRTNDELIAELYGETPAKPAPEKQADDKAQEAQPRLI